MDPRLLLGAAIAGLAVVAVTWLAGRLGGTIGGLLATAPTTSTAAITFLAFEGGNAAIGTQILSSGSSLYAALVGMPVYFYTLKWTRTQRLPVRLAAAILAYMTAYTVGTLALHAMTPPALGAVWMMCCLLLSAGLAFTFLQERLPAQHARPPKLGITWKEGFLRFLSGGAVILLVGFLRDLSPALSTAWAVFPGTFMVSLWVLGMERGAAFSASASQGAVMGIPPLVAYLVTLWAVLPLSEGGWWILISQLAAWTAYFAATGLMTRVGPSVEPETIPA